MRTALLSTIERTEQDETRAYLPLGGRKLIDWQFDLVRDLGCERVICLAEGPSSELDNFRDRVEKAGLEFHAIGGPLQLVGLVSADQELVVLGDGVVIDREFIVEMSLENRGVAVLPATEGIEAGFERVDAENAWAGIFVARGQIAAQLADMPSDSDTISLLLRMALQAGTRLVKVDKGRLSDGTVTLATTAEVITKRETSLIERSAKGASWFGPSNALAQIGAQKLASKYVMRGPVISYSAALLCVAGSAALTIYSLQFWAFVALLVGSFAGALAIALYDLRSKLIGTELSKQFRLIFNILIDYSIINSLTFPYAEGWEQRLILAVMLLGSWRLAELLSSSNHASFWQDRAILIAILLFAIGFGKTTPVIQLLILTAIGISLFLARRGKITQA